MSIMTDITIILINTVMGALGVLMTVFTILECGYYSRDGHLKCRPVKRSSNQGGRGQSVMWWA